ncbi:hypothetical protein [Methylotenera sp.]|uniref:hypothetical protein n=1 Tax=Methylotenera sp. TaxID=2051956 RepID=UPI0024883FEC|nr:hypothetical protein [Methylotenera sp.]MDI1360485.1 hypothetical protein [Methylotenera sp.]
MSDSELSHTKPKVHAKLSVILSLLKAFKLAELLALANNLLAIVTFMYSPVLLLKAMASLILAVGLGIFYFALRIRIDITLFERWDSIEISQLDNVLSNINPKYQAGRTLDERLRGSYRLSNRGLGLLFVQFCLLITAVWLA